MSTSQKDFSGQVERFKTDAALFKQTLEKAIVGQPQLISDLFTAILSGGHVLIEGLPGLGKTHLSKVIASALGITLARVQCTPDLMPSDITGSEILITRPESIEQSFEFRHGPIFSSLVLVDEINRASPKTQAALLEAMQENQVTHAGKSYALPKPFWILATQNPIELEGTYPLPEAQLDRFLFKLKVDFPSGESLTQLIDLTLDEHPADKITTVLSHNRIQEMMTLCKEVVIASEIKHAAVALILTTHGESSDASISASVQQHIRYGASPRGLQAILRAARVHALCGGRAHVALEDIEAAALPALRHRILLTLESEMTGTDSEQFLKDIISTWKHLN